MRWRTTAVALWLTLGFVAWNVIYDRLVAIAAVEFTRAQVMAFERGEVVTPIHEGFSPRVGQAAWWATLGVGPVILAGLAAIHLRARRVQ